MASTSSSSLNPGQACLECRHRKVRCDGIKPICGRCNRLKKECVYQQVVRRLQVEIMEDRIAELESEVQAFMRRPASMGHPLIRKLLGAGSDSDRTEAPASSFLPLYTGIPRNSSTVILGPDGPVFPELMLEGYGSAVIPRSVPESGLGQLDPDSEVPIELSEYLTRMVLPFRDHFHMLMYPPRLLFRLRLPPDHPNSIHPALLNSLYLAACSISGGQMSGYELRFLNQARMESEHALAFVDRLVDFMWASVVLASYYLRRGRIVEAHNSISGAVSFAMAVGLHRAPGTIVSESRILPPPDEIEKYDRVALWCALTQLEASISLRTGLPTVATKDHQTSIEAFSSQPTENQALPSAPDAMLQTKASALLLGIREFIVAAGDSKTGQPLPDIPERHSVLVSVLHNLQQEIPGIEDHMGLHYNESTRIANPAILRLHCYVNFCAILLEGSVATRDGENCKRIVESAELMARLRSTARGDEPLKHIQAQPDMVPCLHSACEVLIRDFMQQRAERVEDETDILEEKEQLIISVFDILLDLIKIFPSTEPIVNNLPELLLERGEYETI